MLRILLHKLGVFLLLDRHSLLCESLVEEVPIFVKDAKQRFNFFPPLLHITLFFLLLVDEFVDREVNKQLLTQIVELFTHFLAAVEAAWVNLHSLHSSVDLHLD